MCGTCLVTTTSQQLPNNTLVVEHNQQQQHKQQQVSMKSLHVCLPPGALNYYTGEGVDILGTSTFSHNVARWRGGEQHHNTTICLV